LLAVYGRRGASRIEPTDWIRVISRHAAGTHPPRQGLGFDVLDVVAADRFETFLEDYLEPFVSEFVTSLARVQDVVLAGKGMLSRFHIGEPLPFDVLGRLQPYPD
jgi:hypothetical protein